jgi:hypothetical protein
MDSIDLILDLWVDGGCNHVSHNIGQPLQNEYPCIRVAGGIASRELHIWVDRNTVWDMVIRGYIVLTSQRYFLGELNTNPVYKFDLCDSDSIDELRLFIKNILNTSSPA